MNIATFQLLVSIPWGNENNEIYLTLEDFPIYAYKSPEQMRQVRAPIRIRIGPQGSLHALADAPLRRDQGEPICIHHFNAKGKFLGKTPLVSIDDYNDELRIRDYVVDAEGSCFLLEQIRSRQSGESSNRLRKIDNEGETRWSFTGPTLSDAFNISELRGTFIRLLMDGRSRIYLPATEHAGVIAEINPDTGKMLQIYTSDKFSNKVFMNENGTVTYVLYFQDVNRRGIGSFNLADQKLTTMIGGIELYGRLIYPFGVDASSNLYVWNNSVIERISYDGKVHVMAALNNIVVRASDGSIFTSRLISGDERYLGVQVEYCLPDGRLRQCELSLPTELRDRHSSGWRLIHVDEHERYYVFGGEEPGRAGTLLIYSRDGELEEKSFSPSDVLSIESSLEGFSFWDVDSEGRVYLPVTDSQGFKVIRLDIKPN